MINKKEAIANVEKYNKKVEETKRNNVKKWVEEDIHKLITEKSLKGLNYCEINIPSNLDKEMIKEYIVNFDYQVEIYNFATLKIKW